MNQFILKPTEEALAQYQRVKDGEVYWHTADFFQFDRNLENDLSVLLNVYMDALIELDEVDEDQAIRRISIVVARKLIYAARQAGISPRDYRDQFNNYIAVIWTPICIWEKNLSGQFTYSLKSAV